MKNVIALLFALWVSTALTYATVYSGKIGDNAVWEMDEATGRLTISGTGSMERVDSHQCPWQDYIEKITEVVVADGITSVSSSAFLSYQKLKKVTLGNSVKRIEGMAFDACGNLTSISLPNSLTYIGDYAFQDCEALKSISLPDGVDSIGVCAFAGTGLKSVKLPESLTFLGDAAFADCFNLLTVTFNSLLTTIPYRCFHSCSSLNNVSLPDNIRHIGMWAFNGCTSFSSFSLGDNMESVHASAFDNTPIINNPANWHNNAFYLKTYLIKADETMEGSVKNIRSNTTLIGDHAFDNTAITEVVIPNSVRHIGEWAFAQCLQLTKVTLGNSVQRIRYCTFEADKALTGIIIPNSVRVIEDNAFTGCTALKTVSFGTSLESIGADAFMECASLEEVVIPDNVRHVGNGAFDNCEKLAKVTVGRNVREIGSAFLYTNNIREIVWNAVELEPEYEFYTSYLQFLFLGEINSLTIGSEVKMLPARFCSGENLTEITIPAGVEKIDYSCFACEQLKTVTCENPTPPALVGGSQHFLTAENVSLRVPCGSLKAYNTSDWKYYFKKMEEYFPYTVSVSSADETMGTAVLGDIHCSEGTAEINVMANTGFVFAAWSDGNTEASRTLQVTSDTTLVATFKVQTFQIRFVDWDGTVLQESETAYNTLPVAPSDPSRPATAQYTYTFKAWKPEITAALADATYKADYDSILNEYLITFLNEDGSTIESRKWIYGQIPVCEEPVKENTDKFAYHFNGWQPELVGVTGEATYQAAFRAVPIHTLIFLDWNGDVLGVVKAEEGTEAAIPAHPIRMGYEFTGWSRDLSLVTTDLYVIALYDRIQDGITVLYKDQQYNLLSSETVAFNLPVIPEEKQSSFLGWYVEAGSIDDGITIRQRFSDIPTDIPGTENTAGRPRKIIRKNQLYIVMPDGTVYDTLGSERTKN